MPTRTYQVNYDITANTIEAVNNFEKLVPPIVRVAEQARAASEAMTQIMEMSRQFKTQFANFNIKPTIDLTSFKTSLASMEQNVKESAIRIRSAIESSLGGSRKAFEQNAGLLGTNNWKNAEATETKLLKSRQQRLEALQKLYRKLSIENMRGTSRTKNLGELGELNKWFDQMAASKPIERVQKLLRDNGIGNIIQKNSNGRWITTDMSKLRDFTKLYEAQVKEFAQQQEKAIKSNMSRTPNLISQLGKRNGSFVSGLLGATPEEIANLKTAMSTINGLMGGVQQTQQQVQNVVKKTAIPKPLKPSGLPTMKEMKKMSEQIASSPVANLKWAHDNEIRSWERLEKAGKIDSLGQKQLNKLRSQRAIWEESMRASTNDPALEAKKAQYSAYEKQWKKFRSDVAAWRAKPYSETTERVVTSANEAKTATAKPFRINIAGNFSKKIESLFKLNRALSALPKGPIEVPVNINIPSGAINALETIKAHLNGINTARGKINKGGFKNIEKLAEATSKSAKKQGTKTTPVKTKVAIDGSAATVDFASMIKSLQEQAGKNVIVLKALFDAKSLTSGLTTAIGELKKVANKASILLKAKLDTTGISKQFTTKIAALRKQVRKSSLVIKAKYDGVGLSGKLRKQIQALKAVATKNPIILKAKFDTTTIAKDLTKVMSGLGKTSIKGMPTIKVNLDIADAQATLNKLLAKIKSASPQTIKMGATTTQTSTGKSSAVGGSYAAPSRTVSEPSATKTSNIANIAASTAAMNRVAQNNKPGIVDRLRKSMYPLTGNVSLGASTPVALDMAKGMGVMYGVGGAMNLVTGGLHDAMEYQNTMETAEEILKKNYSGKNFQKDFTEMSKEVRRVAKQTKFTAPQAADATRFMAMAGLSIPMIKSSVSPIADVAVIGDNDFGEVADKMTNIQTAFQIQPNKMRHVADAITNTFSRTNTDMMMLAESMQYAAPMAHLSGMSLEDTLAMVGIMGNSGIQASMAGTTLRMMLQNTLNPNKKQAALWKKLRVHTRDKDGNLRNMIDILADVKEASKNKFPMADVVSNLFRVTASAGAGALINNIDKVRELAAQNASVGNISGEISARKQNTVKGVWAQMTSSFTEANLKVFEQFQEDIKGMISAVKDYFNSKEAVDNLRQAFDMIRSLMNTLGGFAKGWMWLYNKFGLLFKAVVWTQMFMSQIGLAIKPIMSLVNVFGGLKNMAVGFVSALSGVGGLKKAAVAASVASAVVGGATTTASAATQYASRHTTLQPLTPTAQTAAYLSAYTPYPVYAARMNKLSKDRMFYMIKGNRLKNSIQMPGSLAREAVNPFLFAGLSSFNAANKEDVKHLNEMMKNRTAMSKIYAAHPFQRSAMQRAYAKVGLIDSEMASLRMGNVMKNKKLSQARTYEQLSNIGLLRRYRRMNPTADNDATRRYQEYVRLRREQQIGNIALMSRLRYSSFYHPGKIPEVDRYFANRQRTLETNSVLRRAKQMNNMELMYRASRLNGKTMAAMKFSFKSGMANALNFSSIAASMTGFLASIKKGFASVLFSLSRGVGMLIGPVGAVVAGLTAAGLAAWGVYKAWKGIKEDKAKNIANSNQIKKQADNFINGYKQNISNIEGTVKLYNSNGKVMKNISETGRVLKSTTGNGMTEFAKNFSAINSITDKMSDTDKARLIFSKYVEPNFELSGNGSSFYAKVTRETFNRNLSNQIIKNAASDVARAGGMPVAAHLPGSEKIDLSLVKKQAAISQLYRAGASSKAAMDARKQIFEIYKNAKTIQEARDKAKKLVNTLFGSDSIQAIGEKDANYSSYGEIINNKNIDQFKQYRWGAEQSLYNWINNPINSKLAYFDGMLKLREKLVPFTTKWYEAMSGIMSNMQLMFQDTKGKIHNLSLTFDKYGTPLWNDLYSQFSKLHIEFGNTFKNHVQILSDIAAQMGNIPELNSYIQQIGGIREFLILQIRKLQDFKDTLSWDNFDKNTQKFPGMDRYSGDLSIDNWKKYTEEFYNKYGYMKTPLSYEEWKKRESSKISSPFLSDIEKRKQAAKAADEQINNNEALNKLDKIDKGINKFANSNNNSNGTYNSPIADATKDTNKGLGGNRYKGATARPTQINIKIDKLANFDKIQFLEGKDRDIANAIANATAEAVSNLVPMLNSLVTNDRRADMI